MNATDSIYTDPLMSLEIPPRPGIMLYKDIVPVLLEMDDDQAGRLFKAIMSVDEAMPEFPPQSIERAVWNLIYPRLKQDTDRYIKRVKANRVNTLKRLQKAQQSAAEDSARKS